MSQIGIADDGERPLPRGRKGLATRSAVVDAAREVFIRDGFLGARIRDICKRAGVANGTFYTYFTDKDAVFDAVIEAAEEQMLHQPHLAEHQSGAGPVAMVEAANRAYLESYRENAGIMALLYQVAAINEHHRDVLRKRGEAFFRRNAKSIKRMQAEGLADPELDPYQAARALSSMVSRVAHGTYVLGEEAPLEVLVQTLTRLWVNALRLPDDEVAKLSDVG